MPPRYVAHRHVVKRPWPDVQPPSPPAEDGECPALTPAVGWIGNVLVLDGSETSRTLDGAGAIGSGPASRRLPVRRASSGSGSTRGLAKRLSRRVAGVQRPCARWRRPLPGASAERN